MIPIIRQIKAISESGLMKAVSGNISHIHGMRIYVQEIGNLSTSQNAI
jgi:hypothetical protein